MGDTNRYVVNPDVSCREQGAEGALLFNPDTDGMMVINPTGLIIWQALAQPKTEEEIVARLVEACQDVPADAVAADVSEFLALLLPGGFVGEELGDDAA